MTQSKANHNKNLSYYLSGSDIDKLLPFDVHIHHYRNLNNFNNIDEMLYPNDACILFFQTDYDYKSKSLMGHYTCLCKSPTSKEMYDKNDKLISDKSIVFFDSYGVFPEDQKLKMDKKYNELVGQQENLLAKLLLLSKDKYNLEYNEIPFQKLTDGINTCGRYCVLKIISKDLPLDMFQSFMLIPPVKPDDKTVLLTQPVLDNKITSEKLENNFNDMVLGN